MASFPAKKVIFFLISLSVLVLFLRCSVVQASYEDIEDVHSLPQLPYLPTNFPPAPAPKPHKGGHHHNHHPSPAPVHPPAHAPVVQVHPPTPHPIHAPVHPPAKPPTPAHPHFIPPRKLVAVQGVVYCKHCMFVGVDTLWKAKPLQGAAVKLTCNNTKYRPVVGGATTDMNGYFLIMAPKKVTTSAYHKCRVTLAQSPSKLCDVPTDFRGGLKGAILTPSVPKNRTWPPLIYQIFNVGPLAYEPSKKIPCKDSS